LAAIALVRTNCENAIGLSTVFSARAGRPWQARSYRRQDLCQSNAAVFERAHETAKISPKDILLSARDLDAYC